MLDHVRVQQFLARAAEPAEGSGDHHAAAVEGRLAPARHRVPALRERLRPAPVEDREQRERCELQGCLEDL